MFSKNASPVRRSSVNLTTVIEAREPHSFAPIPLLNRSALDSEVNVRMEKLKQL